MTEFDPGTLELALPSLDEADLTVEIARWRGHVLATLEDLDPVLRGLAVLLTERLCRQLARDYPGAAMLRCRPEPVMPRSRAGAALGGGVAVLADPWAAASMTLVGGELLGPDGLVLDRLPAEHPAQHWLGLLAPMVGVEPVLCLLEDRAWKFRTP